MAGTGLWANRHIAPHGYVTGTCKAVVFLRRLSGLPGQAHRHDVFQ